MTENAVAEADGTDTDRRLVIADLHRTGTGLRIAAGVADIILNCVSNFLGQGVRFRRRNSFAARMGSDGKGIQLLLSDLYVAVVDQD
ncbi:hypothetical protein ACIOC1_04240 [Streptomyces sp. NPDC088197]|uniref:hypothetical protein n=1 Tax=Streptomyces sp. NPDC088197 TaxID=3365840 RepID=UPI00381FF9ED